METVYPRAVFYIKGADKSGSDLGFAVILILINILINQ